MKKLLALFMIAITSTVYASESFVEEVAKSIIKNRQHAIEVNAFVKDGEAFQKMRKKEKITALSNDERQMLREAWMQILSKQAELHSIELEMEKFHSQEKDTFLKEDYFTLKYAAYMAQYRTAIEFIRAMRTVPTADKVLNERFDEFKLDRQTFADFKFEYLNLQKFTQYSGHKLAALSEKNESSPLNDSINEDEDYIDKFNRYKGTIYTIKNAGKISGHILFKLYFPIQKAISEWMGDERVARGNEFLISDEQIKTIHKKLNPGDVLIERREWYLSNIGLPGFWPHAALYIGRPEERKELNADPEVIAWVKSEGIESGSFEELLESKFPAVYKESLGADETAHDYRVLEAMSEGVVFTSLEHSADADSLAAIRPRLANVDIAKGLLTALKYKGRPYDFNFDFRTDAEVVCSELVFYAYQPTKDKNGIEFPVTTTLGRPVVTPNNIIKDLAETHGTDRQQFDLVVFLDGNDKKREAVFSDMENLKTTWNRPKWFIFTQNKK